MMAEVPKADVVVVNPTHFAVALRYDAKTMSAPKIVAKGSRLNALRIREIAEQNQVPIVENPPLARLMFKYGRVGGEIPAELYAAVAEVLAWVYRVNAYRYYRERSLKLEAVNNGTAKLTKIQSGPVVQERRRTAGGRAVCDHPPDDPADPSAVAGHVFGDQHRAVPAGFAFDPLREGAG
jgi:type III secretion system FlhB-like substrate exporter